MRLENAVVIVTGASSGIGAATALELARRGAIPILAARRADLLAALHDRLEVLYGRSRARAIPTDLTRRDHIDALIHQAIEAHGRIDALVNCAGISAGSDIATSSDETMEQVVSVNLLAVARTIQAALPHFPPSGGVIVNVGSVAGEVASSGLYSATKFAVRGLSDSLRRDLASRHIAVVLVEPGFIRTPMTQRVRFPMPGPGIVARAIADSIERPRRRVVVPWPYLPAMYLAKAFPWAVDWLLQRRPIRDRRFGADRSGSAPSTRS